MAAKNPNDGSLPPISDFPTDPTSDVFGALEAPPEIPGYQILGPLGRGGMGVVFRALDVQLKREVAIKLVGAHAAAAPTALDRFRREAEAVARLQHPNIIQIFSYGSAGNGARAAPYLVLELAADGTLAEKIAGRPQPSRDAMRIAYVLARAVQYAHDRGIIHRDLKPQNVLLTPEPKIADFGLAKLISDLGGEPTEPGRPGTPCNMSPEQVSGQHPLGPATDIYALGTIIFEMLTGRPPFKADSRAVTLHLVQHQPPSPPSQFAPGVNRDLDAICLKCLAKNPRDRYASAALLADDLTAALELRPTVALPRTRVRRTLMWTRRHPFSSAWLAAALIASVASGVATYRYKIDTSELKRDRDVVKRQAVVAEDHAEVAKRTKRRHQLAVDYAENLQRAYDAFNNREVALAQTHLASASSELRGWEWGYLNRLCNDQLLTVDTDAEMVFFARGGRELITRSGSQISAWDAVTGKLLSRWNLADAFSAFDIAGEIKILGRALPEPDSALVLAAGNNVVLAQSRTGVVIGSALTSVKVRVWDKNQCLLGRALGKSEVAPVDYINRLIVQPHNTSEAWLVDLRRLSETKLEIAGIDWTNSRAWLDEHHLAILSANNRLSLYSLPTGVKQFEVALTAPRVGEVFLFDDEHCFATYELNINTAEISLVWRSAKDGQPVDDAQRWKVTNWDAVRALNLQKHLIFETYTTVGQPLFKGFQVAAPHVDASFSPAKEVPEWATGAFGAASRFVVDQNHTGLLAIGYRDGAVEVWSLKSGELRARLETPNRSGVRDLAVSPNGDRLASIDDAGNVQLWTLERGQQATRISVVRTPLVSGNWKEEASAALSWRPANVDSETAAAHRWAVPQFRRSLVSRDWRDLVGKPGGEAAEALRPGPVAQEPDGRPTLAWEYRLHSTALTYSLADADAPPHDLIETEHRLTAAVVAAEPSLAVYAAAATPSDGQPNGTQKCLRVFSVDKRDLTRPATELEIHVDVPINAFAVSSQADRLAVVARLGRIDLYNAATGMVVTRVTVKRQPVTSLAIDPAAKWLAVGYETGAVEVIRIADGTSVLDEQAHDREVKCLVFSPHSRYLATGVRDASETEEGNDAGDLSDLKMCTAPALKIWNLASAGAALEIPNAVAGNTTLSFNRDESRIVVLTVRGMAEIWHLETGVRLFAFAGNCCQPCVVSFDPFDDANLATVSSCRLNLSIWSAADPASVPTNPMPFPY